MTEPKYSQVFIDVGEGQPVLLLHGLFGKVSMWKRITESLRKNFRVVVPRLPLFDLPIDQANIKELSRHLHELVEWHRLTNVHLVGHGIGGQLALTYASEHRSNVNKIVVSGSDLFQSEELDVITSVDRDHEMIGEKVRSAFYNSYLAGPALVNEIYRTIENDSTRATIENLVRSSANGSVGPVLNKIDHRVMLLWGLEDKITPPGIAFHFHDCLQNSEIRFIEKCGHLPMVEEPERFVKHLASFFD